MGNLAINRGILRTVPLFAVLTEQQLDTLFLSMQYRSFQRQALMLRSGERSDTLYVILAGRAQVVIEDGEGREMILCSLGPNEFFGELSLVDEHPRSASVQAVDPCEVLCVSRKAVMRCLEENPQAAMLMLNTLAKRVRQADAKIAELAFTDVCSRVARTMVERASNVNGVWVVEPGAEQLARMVAASREMVSRVLTRFQESSLIRRDKRKIILTDPAALTAHADARR
jgi:CRP/FNR family transcriptional regulator, cyclic AMP receptor protein